MHIIDIDVILKYVEIFNVIYLYVLECNTSTTVLPGFN